ncbi:cupin domain-containing protein [Pedobacter sp. PAMC26386]|nr:cupin domain-containing protein [Pedobacter sp. PAMC26386]
MKNKASYWIDRLDLQSHPEGGYYREIFRSHAEVNRDNESELRRACTSIYYLLEGSDFSGFHRLKSDELWYFHIGQPINIHVLDADGGYKCIELSDSETGNLQVSIEPNCWFAAEVSSKRDFALVSCAVAPGFDFSEFEMATKSSLSNVYPSQKTLIEKLCRF